MTPTPFDRYFQDEVLNADPVKLVWLLYRGATEAVQAARRSLGQGDIRGRSRYINRAWGILQELAGSLNHAEGGEISRRLAALYSYMQSRLIDANVQQTEAPLTEIETLLLTLADAWQSAGSHAAEPEAGAAKPEVAFQPQHDRDQDPERLALAVG